MPPRTQSNTMGEVHSEGVERGVGTSNSMPGSDLASMMSQMMADLRNEIKEGQVRMHATQNALFEDLKELKESQKTIHADHNVLVQEINALKVSRSSRPHTPRSDSIHRFVPEENNEEEGNYERHGVDEQGEHGLGRFRNRHGDVENGRFGMGNGVNGRFRAGNKHGRVGNYGGNERYIRDRYYEEEPRHRYDDPTKAMKHTFPEFHGRFDPEAYLEWESQVDKIFSLHNYSEGDKVKIAIAEFRGHANTWWNDLMRRRRMVRGGEVGSWEELCELMRGTFVPKSYYLKLRGELQDLRQGTKSVMDYYYELLSLMSKIGVDEPEEATQDRFIHGLNIPLKHKVQVEALRGITLGEVLGFAETFERQGKELALSKAKMASSQTGGGTGVSKWSTPTKKLESSSNSQGKTPYKALPVHKSPKPLIPWRTKRYNVLNVRDSVTMPVSALTNV